MKRVTSNQSMTKLIEDKLKAKANYIYYGQFKGLFGWRKNHVNDVNIFN